MKIQNEEFRKHTPPMVWRSVFQNVYLCASFNDAIGLCSRLLRHGAQQRILRSLGTCLGGGFQDPDSCCLFEHLPDHESRRIAMSCAAFYSHPSPHQRTMAIRPLDHDLESSKELDE